MARTIIGPSKYVQGNGELRNLQKHVEHLGHSFFIIVSQAGLDRVQPTILESFEGTGAKLVFEVCNGECTRAEIERLQGVLQENACSCVIGVGGGKIIDTAKAVGFFEQLPVVVVPTIASTDAPCSALSILYSPEGVFSEILRLDRNPDLVLLDSAIIARAPVRLLVSGMGDALATYFEARACSRSGADNMAGEKPTLAGMAIAQLCYQTLLRDGFSAKLAVQNRVVTPAVENIIEANTYLSGIGFESGGLAAAHSVHNGLTVLEPCRRLYHGEKVAFGTLVQLVLENAGMEETKQVIAFCRTVGLPVKLEDLGIGGASLDDIKEVAKAACAEGETIHNMPFPVHPGDVVAAILTADELGRRA